MLRLQGKLRDFIRIEKELRMKIKNVQDKDENLVSKLEEALCFGKMIFMLKPVVSKHMKQIKSVIENDFETEFSHQEHDQNMELKILAQKITDLQS
mgnify:FL=1